MRFLHVHPFVFQHTASLSNISFPHCTYAPSFRETHSGSILFRIRAIRIENFIPSFLASSSSHIPQGCPQIFDLPHALMSIALLIPSIFRFLHGWTCTHAQQNSFSTPTPFLSFRLRYMRCHDRSLFCFLSFRRFVFVFVHYWNSQHMTRRTSLFRSLRCVGTAMPVTLLISWDKEDRYKVVLYWRFLNGRI